jgi:NAD(P)-dependent dehydrogenase (short-subunit alcohol dehydrogenase family)
VTPSPQTVVITGASAGVGRATAHAFAAEGARVALLARSEESLAAAAREVRDKGGEALWIVCDVADDSAVEAAAARVEAELGPIDVWVNNAMVGALAPFADTDPAAFERITQVTYLGVVNGTRAALKRMRPRDRGVVVQIGSSLAYRGIPLQAAYCGAKHAIQGFTESVRCELLHDGSKVHLTMVQLPALNTPQFGMVRNAMPKRPMPVPPIYEPEVAADGIVWASKHRRREVWIGKSTPLVIVGNALAPTAGDHFLATTGYDDQQADLPPESGPDYLFAPQPGDHGTRGVYSELARTSSRQLKLTKVLPDWAAGMVSAAAGRGVGEALKRLGG